MKVLLTGSTGFIGTHLKRIEPKLFKCVVRKDSNTPFEDSYVINDLNEHTDWSDAFEGVDAIIHLAGLTHSYEYSEAQYQSVNVEGTLNLAREAAEAKVKRFVFVSSVAVNGSFTKELPFDTFASPNPTSAFARSKHTTELGLKQIANETGLEIVIVRATLVYGPNAPGNFGSLIRIVKKSCCLPFGRTRNKRSFIAVQNLADLLINCTKNPKAAGHIFLASDGKSVSIKEFTNAIAKGLNTTIIQLPIPLSTMRFGAKMLGKSTIAEQLLGNLETDSSSLQNVLKWVPPYTMEEAMLLLSKFEDRK